jgi:hypothetical protein
VAGSGVSAGWGEQVMIKDIPWEQMFRVANFFRPPHMTLPKAESENLVFYYNCATAFEADQFNLVSQ